MANLKTTEKKTKAQSMGLHTDCLLYTSEAADE